MNRLNGPYSYQNARRGGWLVRDADGNLIAKCASSYTAQMIATNLTKCWEREKAKRDGGGWEHEDMSEQ